MTLIVAGGSTAYGATTQTFEANTTKFDSGVDNTCVYIYSVTGHAYQAQKCASDLETGTRHYVVFTNGEYDNAVNKSYEYVSSTTSYDCSSSSYSQCVTAVTTGKITEGTFSTDFTLTQLKTNAIAGIAGQTGTAGVSSFTGWAGTQLGKLLGAGLGFVESIVPWIIALLCIWGIVYLVRKGFGFFHILG